MKVYLAADHAGFDLKEKLKPFVASLGHEAIDCGAFALDKHDDYPLFIRVAAAKLAADAAQGIESRAIVIGGSGQGEAMAANRFAGVRCAVFYGEPEARQVDADGKSIDIITGARDHNDANCLSLGGRFLSEDAAKGALRGFLELPFSGDARHSRRIRMLDA